MPAKPSTESANLLSHPADTASRASDDLDGETETVDSTFTDTPWQADQEWANALTHGIAAAVTIFLAVGLLRSAGDSDRSIGMMISCLAYSLSVLGTFTFSTLSHVVSPSPLLNRLRAWDQAMIYMMISGTYTPIIYRFADQPVRAWLLAAIWVAAVAGFLAKVAANHRINSIGTVSYLLLGWLPAIPLIGQVPTIVVIWMMIGGVLYTIGVACLINDRKVRYLHAVWHLFVMSAAFSHYWTILKHIVPANG